MASDMAMPMDVVTMALATKTKTAGRNGGTAMNVVAMASATETKMAGSNVGGK